jgi:anti-anti-sigma factor
VDGHAATAHGGRAALGNDGGRFDAVVATAELGDSRCVVQVHGYLGFASAQALERELAPLSARPRVRVTLDLSGAAAIDSTALAVVLQAVVRLRSTGGDLEIVAPVDSLRRRLSISGLDRVISVRDRA